MGWRLAYWLVAGAFAIAMLGTTLPTPLYPLYADRFGFGALTVTVIFAMYPLGVVLALLAFGPASDSLGRRPVLLTGLVAAATSSVIFVVVSTVQSDGVPLLVVARCFSGLSAGLITGTATAALADYAQGTGRSHAAMTATAVNMGGLGLGPLIGGVLAQYAPDPLRIPFAVHLGMVALAVVAVILSPEPLVIATGRRQVRMQRLRVPAESRGALRQAGLAGFAGFAVLGLFAAVGPAILGALGQRNAALTGLVVFSVFGASALGQLLSGSLPTPATLLLGTATLIVGVCAIGLSVVTYSLALLVGGGVVAGVGQGLSFRAALDRVGASSPLDQRGALASAFFIICYIGISIPVLGIGLGAKTYGLETTVAVFTGSIATIAACAGVGIVAERRRGSLGAASPN